MNIGICGTGEQMAKFFNIDSKNDQDTIVTIQELLNGTDLLIFFYNMRNPKKGPSSLTLAVDEYPIATITKTVSETPDVIVIPEVVLPKSSSIKLTPTIPSHTLHVTQRLSQRKKILGVPPLTWTALPAKLKNVLPPSFRRADTGGGGDCLFSCISQGIINELAQGTELSTSYKGLDLSVPKLRERIGNYINAIPEADFQDLIAMTMSSPLELLGSGIKIDSNITRQQYIDLWVVGKPKLWGNQIAISALGWSLNLQFIVCDEDISILTINRHESVTTDKYMFLSFSKSVNHYTLIGEEKSGRVTTLFNMSSIPEMVKKQLRI